MPRPFSSRTLRKSSPGHWRRAVRFHAAAGLEEAIERIGADLHNQYLVTYSPNNKDEGGFHEISVQVSGRRDVKVRTRPGYWLGQK